MTMSNEDSERGLRSKDIIPVLMLVGYVLVNLWGKWPRWSWILLILAASSFALDHYRSLKPVFAWWKGRKESRKDDKVAGEELRELEEFARRFAQFVNRQNSDTLHYIVESDIYQGQPALRADCQLPNVDIWIYQRQYFAERLERQSKRMKELRPALMEFHYLISSYNNFCVAAILDLLPQNIRAQVTPQARAKLNLFQQKFSHYLGDYQLFVERLVKERPSLNGTPSTFNMPKPFI
jgi:hypothetical protein